MLLLFHQSTSYNPDYEKKPLKPNCSSKVILKAMHASLYNKYSYAQNYYYTNNLNMIITNQGKPSIIHIYDQEYFECKEYLSKYHEKEVIHKLKKLIQIHQYSLNAPRYFLEPISLDLLVDKNYTKKRKLRQRNLQQKQQTQYNNKLNLANQFLKMKLISYDPILKDLNDSKPTTMQFVDMLNEYNIYNKQFRNAQFIIEMEQHQKQSVLDENVKIKQFNQIVSFNKNSNLSGSTRLSSTRIQKEPNIRNILMQHYTQLNYQNFLNQRMIIQGESNSNTNKVLLKNTTNLENLQKCNNNNNNNKICLYKTKQPKPIDVMMESIRSQQQQQQIQSSRANPENKRIQSKPFFSPKGQVTSNLNFRRVRSNITKIR